MKLCSQCAIFVLACLGSYAQSPQPPATADELQFFRFMLMSVASIDHHPKAISAYEAGLVKQFGLNTQESAFIHAEGQRLNALLKQLRHSSQALLSGKRNLSASDAAALTALINEREQLIASLANEILNTVRQETPLTLGYPGISWPARELTANDKHDGRDRKLRKRRA